MGHTTRKDADKVAIYIDAHEDYDKGCGGNGILYHRGNTRTMH